MTSLLFTAKVSIFDNRKFGVKGEKLEFQEIQIIELRSLSSISGFFDFE